MSYVPKKWRERPPEPRKDWRALDKSSERPSEPVRRKGRRLSKVVEAAKVVRPPVSTNDPLRRAGFINPTGKPKDHRADVVEAKPLLQPLVNWGPSMLRRKFSETELGQAVDYCLTRGLQIPWYGDRRNLYEPDVARLVNDPNIAIAVAVLRARRRPRGRPKKKS